MSDGWQRLCVTDDPEYAQEIRNRGRCIFRAKYGDPDCIETAIYEYRTAVNDMFICCQKCSDEWEKIPMPNWTRLDLGKASRKKCDCPISIVMTIGCADKKNHI